MEKEKKKQGFAVCPENINRDGAPLKEWTWTKIFKEEVEKLDEKSKKKIKRIMAEKMIDKVIKDSDVQAFKEIANRMDGLPKQNLDLTSGGEVLAGFNYVKPTRKNNND